MTLILRQKGPYPHGHPRCIVGSALPPPGQAGDGLPLPHPDPGGPLPGLHPRCGRPLPGDSKGPCPLLPAHPPAEPGGGDHRWLRGAGPGRYRSSGGHARYGREMRSVQGVCRGGRGSPLCGHPGRRGDGPNHRPDLQELWRHQPGGHRRPPLL